jgi:hypothetical protein
VVALAAVHVFLPRTGRWRRHRWGPQHDGAKAAARACGCGRPATRGCSTTSAKLKRQISCSAAIGRRKPGLGTVASTCRGFRGRRGRHAGTFRRDCKRTPLREVRVQDEPSAADGRLRGGGTRTTAACCCSADAAAKNGTTKSGQARLTLPLLDCGPLAVAAWCSCCIAPSSF